MTLLNDVTGVSVNLGNGSNTLNLAAGTNSLDNVFNAQHVNGTASDDTLTVTTGLGNPDGNPIVDLGAGNDTLNLAASFVTLTALNIEHITGSAADNGVTLNNNVTGVTFDLGGGNDLLSLAAGANSISVTNVENVSSSDFSTSSNDSLTLLNDVSGLTVNLGNGSNTLNLFGGTNSFVDIFNVHQVNGTASDDVLSVSDTIGNQDGNPIVDLGGGNDTLSFGSQFLSLTALHIEHISGSAGDNGLTLNNTVSGIDIDLGGGNDTGHLAPGVNSLSVENVESINSTDFNPASPSDDTLTLLNGVSGLTVNLANGTNTLQLAAGTNSLVNVFGVQNINGSATDDTLTIQGSVGATTIDLGGGNDTLNLSGGAFGVTVLNVESVNGSTGSDSIAIGNATGATTITGGLGADIMTASAGADTFRFTSVADSPSAGNDTITNFDADHDTFKFDGMMGANGFASAVHFIGTAGFDQSGLSEANLVNVGGVTVLQIDVDGDGQMTSHDMAIQLANLTGTLQDHNFMLT